MWHRGDGRVSSARGVRVWPSSIAGRRRRRKRTWNMPCMSLTLEVSKLSGWSKAIVFCRVQRGHMPGREKCVARRWHRGKGESAARAAWVWPSSGVWPRKAQAEAHSEHVAHACDAGGFEDQQLVESIRTLPSPKGASDRGKRVHSPEKWHRGKGESAAHTRRACGPARECGHNAQAEAHPEHVAHVCDAGGLEAQRLVESIRILRSSTGYPTEGTRGTEEMAHGG